jgi:GDPmannose 4,6-dehydratase
VERSALITGITGQDGCYLSRFLLDRGYRVVGTYNQLRNSNLRGLKEVGSLSRISLRPLDLNSFTDVQRCILEEEVDEVYHLAAQSSVAESFRAPSHTMHVNTVPTINILESVRLTLSDTRVYHASSSEMYGNVNGLPITEETLFNPASPYAVSKVAAHHSVKCYRDSYDLFAVSGILFNHESILRRANFFSSKLIRQSLELARGERERITFGDLSVKRDFGYAPKYVEAMWLMLQQKEPYDFLICSGKSVSLRELIEHVFDRLGISLDRIQIDSSLFRPNEIPDIFGTNRRAKEKLGWDYDLTAFDVMDQLLADTKMRNGNL